MPIFDDGTHYCGECKTIYKFNYKKTFCNPVCLNCDNSYDHISGHGKYCYDCGLKKKKFIDKSTENGFYFIYCDNACYNESIIRLQKCDKKKKKKESSSEESSSESD